MGSLVAIPIIYAYAFFNLPAYLWFTLVVNVVGVLICAKATKELSLGYMFIASALERPKVPKKGRQRFLKTKLGSVVNKWNKMSTEEKLKLRCEELASMMDAKLITFELLY